MAQIDFIVVHFTDKNNVERILRVNPLEVEAIFLQKRKVPNFEQLEANGTESIAKAPETALQGNKNAAASSALSDVCYLIGGQLFCWEQ